MRAQRRSFSRRACRPLPGTGSVGGIRSDQARAPSRAGTRCQGLARLASGAARTANGRRSWRVLSAAITGAALGGTPRPASCDTSAHTNAGLRCRPAARGQAAMLPSRLARGCGDRPTGPLYARSGAPSRRAFRRGIAGPGAIRAAGMPDALVRGAGRKPTPAA